MGNYTAYINNLKSQRASYESNIKNYLSEIEKEKEILRQYQEMKGRLSEARDLLKKATEYLNKAKDKYKEGYQSSNNDEQKFTYLIGLLTLKPGYIESCISVAETKIEEHKKRIEQLETSISNTRSIISGLNASISAFEKLNN